MQSGVQLLRASARAHRVRVDSGSASKPPLFLVGVSFGAMLSVHTLLREPSFGGIDVAGVILLAAFIDVPRPPLLRLQEGLAPLLLAIGLGRARRAIRTLTWLVRQCCNAAVPQCRSAAVRIFRAAVPGQIHTSPVVSPTP